jgi:hypothetical protein
MYSSTGGARASAETQSSTARVISEGLNEVILLEEKRLETRLPGNAKTRGIFPHLNKNFSRRGQRAAKSSVAPGSRPLFEAKLGFSSRQQL